MTVHPVSPVSPLRAALAGTLTEILRPRDPAGRALLLLAALMAASAAFHLLVQLASGGPWTGPVSWRKPIAFGASVSILALSLSWALGRLPHFRGRTGSARVFAIAAIVEVGLITLQRWRGVSSHFNEASAVDAAIFNAMGLLILLMMGIILFWTIAAARARTAAPAERAAALTGLALLDLALLTGLAIIVHGRLAPDSPAQIGAAGLLKVPHAVSIHGIQIIALLSIWLAARGVSSAARVRALWTAAAGWTGLVAATGLQAATGRHPLDLDPLLAALHLAALAGVALPFLRSAARPAPAAAPGQAPAPAGEPGTSR